jgi:hypothetical protein
VLLPGNIDSCHVKFALRCRFSVDGARQEAEHISFGVALFLDEIRVAAHFRGAPMNSHFHVEKELYLFDPQTWRLVLDDSVGTPNVSTK